MVKDCLICRGKKLKYLYSKNNYRLFKCSSCFSCFISPFPSESKLKKFYQNFDYRIGFQNEKTIRKDAKRTLRNLKIMINKQGKLLDIGCGPGFFMDEARKCDWDVFGIDTSKKLTLYAKEKLKLICVNADFNNYRYKNSSFDVITLIQVLEHIVNPYPLLIKVHNLLKPKGILCISTPNIESILAKILGKDFNYMIPPEHVFFYSPKGIKILLKKSGFKVKKVITWGYPSDLSIIIKRIFKMYMIEKTKKSFIKKKKKHISNSINLKFKTFLKDIIFERIFCCLFFYLLNINYRGSTIEVYAEKE